MISGRQLLWLKGDCWELFRGGEIVGINSVGKVLNKLQGSAASLVNISLPNYYFIPVACIVCPCTAALLYSDTSFRFTL